MTRRVVAVLLLGCVVLAGCKSWPCGKSCKSKGWQSLFDGKSLDGWKASERQGTFSVKDGVIVVKGDRSHLFYVGPVGGANFKNFEFKADVMTEPGSNSGMYIHTEYQEKGWPTKGFEIQVNNSHSDWKRTASIYDVKNVKETFVKDNEWFTQHIIAKDKTITVKVNDKVVNEWTEPESFSSEGWPGRKLTSGTVALQGHDPKSVIYYKNIKVKILP